MERVLKINLWRRHAFLYIKNNQGGIDVLCSFKCVNIRLVPFDSGVHICFTGHERYCGVPMKCGSINMDFVDRIVLELNTCRVIGAIC